MRPARPAPSLACCASFLSGASGRSAWAAVSRVIAERVRIVLCSCFAVDAERVLVCQRSMQWYEQYAALAALLRAPATSSRAAICSQLGRVFRWKRSLAAVAPPASLQAPARCGGQHAQNFHSAREHVEFCQRGRNSGIRNSSGITMLQTYIRAASRGAAPRRAPADRGAPPKALHLAAARRSTTTAARASIVHDKLVLTPAQRRRHGFNEALAMTL